MGDGSVVVKEEPDYIETLLEERSSITEEKDFPEYVDLNSFLGKNKVKKVLADPENLFTCNKCPIRYRNSEFLAIHKAIHSPDLTCPVCSEVFCSRNKLKEHVNAHIMQKRNVEPQIAFPCSYCEKTFASTKQLRIHLRVHTNERPYNCEICGNGFKQLAALKTHYVTHTKERQFICEVCNGTYTTASSLKRHKTRIHDRARTIKCSRCDAKFQNMADFRTHLEEERGFRRQCPYCNELFFSKRMFEVHKRQHSESNKHCKLCGKETENRKQFLEHRLLHLSYSEEELREAYKSRSFSCKFCSIVYKTKNTLLRHMKAHEDQSPKHEIKTCPKLQRNESG